MWLQLSVGKINILFTTSPQKCYFIWQKYGAKADRILKGVITIYTQKTLPHVSIAFSKLFHLRGKNLSLQMNLGIKVSPRKGI